MSNEETMTSTDESAQLANQQAARQQQQNIQVQVKDDNAISCYANFCRVTGSPEELIVDFGLNPQPVGIPKDPIVVQQRIILNFYTAKRLLAALKDNISKYEATFGPIKQTNEMPQFPVNFGGTIGEA